MDQLPAYIAVESAEADVVVSSSGDIELNSFMLALSSSLVARHRIALDRGLSESPPAARS